MKLSQIYDSNYG